MIRKAIGIILVSLAAVITVLLVTGGGPLVPHMIGPITLAAIGVFLLAFNRNAKRSAE
jgi:hypothetical protein